MSDRLWQDQYNTSYKYMIYSSLILGETESLIPWLYYSVTISNDSTNNSWFLLRNYNLIRFFCTVPKKGSYSGIKCLRFLFFLPLNGTSLFFIIMIEISRIERNLSLEHKTPARIQFGGLVRTLVTSLLVTNQYRDYDNNSQWENVDRKRQPKKEKSNIPSG